MPAVTKTTHLNNHQYENNNHHYAANHNNHGMANGILPTTHYGATNLNKRQNATPVSPAAMATSIFRPARTKNKHLRMILLDSVHNRCTPMTKSGRINGKCYVFIVICEHHNSSPTECKTKRNDGKW
jgi:hypothetical protein